MVKKLGIFVSHPVQYHVPLWRQLAADGRFDVDVIYFSRQGVDGGRDPGFGRSIQWDVDLLAGYSHRFVGNWPIEKVAAAHIPNLSKELMGYDVIMLHGYTQKFAKEIVKNKKRFGYAIVLRGEFTDCTEYPRPFWRTCLRNAYLRRFYSFVDAFCYIGQDALTHLRRFRIPEERLFFSPYNVDSDYFEAARRRIGRSEARSSLGIRDDETVFLFSGKMISRKQPLLFARAANLVARQRDCHFILLGDGPELNAVSNELGELVTAGKAILPGFTNQSELAKYFAAADAFVFPSRYDTWGLVLNEAMHFGLYSIVSDRVGARHDLIEPGVTGAIFRHDSEQELVREMLTCSRHGFVNAERKEQIAARIAHFSNATAAAGIARAVSTLVDNQSDSRA